MFNLKWAMVLGVAGLLLSLVIGLFSGIGFPHVFVRAGIMGGVFFALGCGLWLLINNFIPELLFTESNNENDEGESDAQFDGPGSRVNITVDEPQNLPEIFRNLDHGDEVGNIIDLVTGSFRPEAAAAPAAPSPSFAPAGASFGEQGIDQNPQDGYTGNSNPSDSPASSRPVSTSSESPTGSPPSTSSGGGLSSPAGAGSDLPDLTGGLGDLEGMAGFFSGPEDAGADEAEEAALPERRPTGNKSEKLEGDFDPKDLAMGIRTVLSKDD